MKLCSGSWALSTAGEVSPTSDINITCPPQEGEASPDESSWGRAEERQRAACAKSFSEQQGGCKVWVCSSCVYRVPQEPGLCTQEPLWKSCCAETDEPTRWCSVAVRHKDTARSLPSIYFILSPPNYAAHFPAASPPPRLRPLPRTRGPLSPTTTPGSLRAARPLLSPLRRRSQGLRAASGPGHTAPSPAKPSRAELSWAEAPLTRPRPHGRRPPAVSGATAGAGPR